MNEIVRALKEGGSWTHEELLEIADKLAAQVTMLEELLRVTKEAFLGHIRSKPGMGFDEAEEFVQDEIKKHVKWEQSIGSGYASPTRYAVLDPGSIKNEG
jgi:hypothetical protein